MVKDIKKFRDFFFKPNQTRPETGKSGRRRIDSSAAKGTGKKEADRSRDKGNERLPAGGSRRERLTSPAGPLRAPFPRPRAALAVDSGA